MADVVTFAPGRVNLIGEHVDYCGGAVLPLALPLGVTVRAVPRDDELVTVRSAGFDGVATVEPAARPGDVTPSWARYAAGVMDVLRDERLPLVGFDAVVTSDLPAGAGLASSAAFDVAFARSALAVSGCADAIPAGAALADVCRRAEERAAGVRCGIMDPYVALHGETGRALLLDCGTLEHRGVALGDVAIVVADSGVRHALAASAYNTRRAECASAFRALIGTGCRAPFLGAATEEDVHRAALREPLASRARHVATESARTRAAAAALERGDVEAFGALLDASHDSLRDDFEVSCDELDELVAAARAVPGVLGSRMTGGGFGGCTVTAVRPDAVDAALAALLPLAGPAGAIRVA